MAKFKKGEGGRPKGAKNKSSVKVREAFSDLLNDNLPQLKEDIRELEAKDRVKILLDIAKFVIPTLRSQEHTGHEHEPITLIERVIVDPPIND